MALFKSTLAKERKAVPFRKEFTRHNIKGLNKNLGIAPLISTLYSLQKTDTLGLKKAIAKKR